MSTPAVDTTAPHPRRLVDALVPPTQRRDWTVVADKLDLDSGDTRAKRSAFWVMLVLAGVIAVSGVVTDSTATVIGAMIIAPLSTPILGIGLGIVTGERSAILRSVAYVLGGVALVVVLGLLVTLVLPATTGVADNSQVTGRTAPGVGDLVAAFATGFAGAIALTRRDLGDILPGIAIAISLVPPLGVVGVCLGVGQPALAAGALLLFASNAVALVVAATVVFSAVGYGAQARAARRAAEARRRHATTLVALVAVLAVAIPMIANSVQAVLADLWLRQASAAAQEWVRGVDEAVIEDVSWLGQDLVVEVRSPGDLPDAAPLQEQVDSLVPWEPRVIVVHTVGERVES
ncbi:TIGR00341 family protein [Occultella glacieicola]|uniref:TIGR00341 family protein n=1 Tax=Occultella glacieicola TaxID=2518684 RepID=A0ABY2EA35_9MICO|nr:TIGR00341 family protein [Occultella glacieicola]TDE98811.1 TIGR00341 family protein [Occultella glacieicola]